MAITLAMVTWVYLNPFLTLITENPVANKCIVMYLHHWIYWGNEMTLYYRFTSFISLFPYKTLVLFFSPSLSPLLPFSFSFSPLLSVRLAPFSLTVRRYLKDQITMATISHIIIAHTCIWWLFLFWRVCQCTRTSLADRQVTCSGEEGTMLPSVGSMSLHTGSNADKHTQRSCDDSWQTFTCQLSPSSANRSSAAQSYFTSLKHA